jgi:DNA-binding response OmpR family regulator
VTGMPPSEAEAAPAGLGPILVVDDDARVRQTIQWTLEDAGFLVETAGDGRGALMLAARRRPALMVLDLTLPDTTGELVAAQMQALYPDPIPLLVITADGHAAEKARRVDAFAYLHKPFDIDDLVSAVRQGVTRA